MAKATAAVPRIRAKTPIGILKAVIKLIREEPRRYYQSDWIRTYPVWRLNKRGVGGKASMPPCGTVCCVAGWVVVGKRAAYEPVEYLEHLDAFSGAKSALGLSDSQASRLFDGLAVSNQRRFEQRKGAMPVIGTRAYAETGIRHIERFMRDELGYTGPKL